MSELTPCNFCNLEDIRFRARREGKRVTLLPAEAGGIDCFAHPRKLQIKQLSKEARKKYFRAWFMELTDHCVC